MIFLFILKHNFPKDGQKSYTKPCQIIHVIPMNEICAWKYIFLKQIWQIK